MSFGHDDPQNSICFGSQVGGGAEEKKGVTEVNASQQKVPAHPWFETEQDKW